MSVNSNLQSGRARTRVSQFTSSGSWTAPVGVSSVRVLAVGGGGGGGAASTTSTNVALGGGGGGGGVYDGSLTVVPGTTYTITIGTGGAGSTSGSTAGSNGTSTTFGSLMTAPGGQGGSSVTNTTVTLPSANPGGSSGGYGYGVASANYKLQGGGHGAGAGCAIIPIGTINYSATQTFVFPYQFFDGYSIRAFPYVHYFAISALTASGVVAPSAGTTGFANIKRNINPSKTYQDISYIPGWPWKDLGAGGVGLIQPVTGGFSNISTAMSLIHPSAGRIDGNPTVDSNGANNGTDGLANSGAGGGGSRAYAGSFTGNGGTGGSGYLEITWEE